jgi:hypothetical protein
MKFKNKDTGEEYNLLSRVKMKLPNVDTWIDGFIFEPSLRGGDPHVIEEGEFLNYYEVVIPKEEWFQKPSIKAGGGMATHFSKDDPR